jgi:DNA-binding NarL/FixJ family response regulator
MIRVLIAEDQALIRNGLRVMLGAEDDIEVVGEAENGEEAVALAQSLRPDLILMDIRMPEVDGVEATRRIVADPELDAVKVLILTTYESDEHVFEALRCGAGGFLVKDAEPGEILRGVRTVATGDSLLSPSVTGRLIAEFAALPRTGGRPSAEIDELTAREREVMALVAGGLTNDDIAERLVVSPATAKTHVSRAMRKLHAHDRAQLVVLAYQTGLVTAGGPTRFTDNPYGVSTR